ncbi:hypothetical protein SAZ10_02370 [Mesorhizobium sp. BAC0120]|uniref:hypothetical protein n=1 Tax=Mesorhizobium sp. BAC0120 TaxID=3090670 RepID=UPI00298C53FB|nr:hypothetical protein [Mesorhizobium sp. BAC0120]MDW6020602.1 hypothetical protein [Mesorhizobium sp. BAC0120]
MKFKLIVLAALSLGLAGAPIASAQNNTRTSSTGSAETDASHFLSGPGTEDFFTDENKRTLKSEDEVKKTYEAMNKDDQAKLKAACAANQESRFSNLCKIVSAM